MSNTFQIGNVLLLEGVNPALPVYLVTELSAEKMQELKKDQNFTNFFQVYTVVTKDMFSDLGSFKKLLFRVYVVCHEFVVLR